MGGNSGDGGSSLGSTGGASSQDVEGGQAPVLGGVSEAELDAFVSKLRTDKNRVVPADAQSRGRKDMMSERLHAGRRSLVSSRPEEVVSHAWYVAMAGKVSGPHDAPALKAHWERGELGPDSLCWRDGFNAWLPLCQVLELAEALVPLPQEKLPTPVEPSASEAAGAPAFELKGAEALKSLSGDAAPVTEPALAPMPVEAPVPVVSAPEPVVVPTAVMSPPVDPVGAHAVLVTAQEAARVEVRWRGGVWLALLGGVSGGIAVAVVLGLLGSAEGRAFLSRLTSRETVGTVSAPATPGGAQAAPGASGAGVASGALGGVLGGTSGAAGPVPGVTGPGGAPGTPGESSGIVGAGSAPGTASAAPGPLAASASAGIPGAGAAPGTAGAVPGTLGGGAVSTSPGTPGAGSTPGAIAGASSGKGGLGSASGATALAGALDRGGAVPVLSASGGGSATGVARSAASSASELETESAPSREPVARAEVSASALALEKRPAGPPATEEDLDDDFDLEANPEGDAPPAETLGPDKAYERELAGPPPGAKAREERTVYVPPDPSMPPAELAQSDIFEVVLANKADITTCASEQQPPGEGGRVVLRWTILPSGQVSEVVTETASLKGTPLARCIEGKVRAWTFPKHQEQGGPVRFPFVF